MHSIRPAAVLAFAAALHAGSAAALRAQAVPADADTAPSIIVMPLPTPVPPTAPVQGGAWSFLPLPGGMEEARLRAAQLRGHARADGYLLRSASSLSRREGSYLALVAPRVEAGFNTRVPYGTSDGGLWAGRGGSARLIAGIDAQAGPLRLVIAPEVTWAQNAAFDDLLPEEWDEAQRRTYTAPWFTGPHSIDLPYRFGDAARTEVLPGESSLLLRAGPVEAGVATESQWWGPGARGALLLSSSAGGFPHVTLRTARPLRTPLGSVEGRWIIGRLSSSAYDTASVGEERSLSGAALVLSPRRGLSVGVARVVYQPSDERQALGDAADVFTRWTAAGDTMVNQPYEQMVSVFGRWVFPEEGAEVYAEWGRRRIPRLRDLLERPEATQGYLLGFGWLRPAGRGAVRLAGEAAYLEKSAAYRAEPLASWYAGRAVPQGYTHRGQPLGFFIGPGASGQWLSADLERRTWEAGLGFSRIRWANDAYYDKPGGTPARYRAHDVSILGTLRGAVAAGPLWVTGEWTAGRRYNFLFQNQSLDFTQRYLTTSPFNQTFRLGISVLPPRG